MNQKNRLFALLLLPALCISFLLSGCSKEPPTPPDQVAVAFYDLVIRQEAAKLKDILGYESEDALWDEFTGGQDNYKNEMIGSVKAQFSQLGLELTDEDTSKLFDGIMTALGKLEFTAEVTEMDEKEKTALVTAHIGYFDSSALQEMTTNAATAALEEMGDSAMQSEEDMAKFLTAYLGKFCDGLSALEPADGQKDLQVAFELTKVDVSGKTKEVWMPVDAEKFGSDLSSAALGM